MARGPTCDRPQRSRSLYAGRVDVEAVRVDVEAVRVAVYESFSPTGHAPELDRLATRFAVAETEIDDALRTLADGRHLVLGPDGSM